MKYLIVVVSCVAIIHGAHGCSAGEMDKQLAQYIEDCVSEEGITIDELKLLQYGELKKDEASKNAMCYTRCMLNKFDVMDNGVLKGDEIIKKFAPHAGEDKIKDIVDECKDGTGDDECEKEFNIFSCFMKHKEAFGPH